MALPRPVRSLWPLALLVIVPAPSLQAGDARPSEADAAAKVDAALTRGLAPQVRLPAVADDPTFLRRVTLDLTGKLPDPEGLRRFAADTAPDKRAKVVDQLLQTDAYAVNWGRYWRDALTYHSTASANYIRWKSFDE